MLVLETQYTFRIKKEYFLELRKEGQQSED